MNGERSFWPWLGRALFVVFLIVRLGALAAIGISFLPSITADTQMQAVLIALLVDMGAALLLFAVNKGVRFLRKSGSRSLVLSPLLLLAVFILSIVAAGMEPGTDAARAMETACLGVALLYLVLAHVFVVLNLVAFFKKGPAE